jgi:hypothetical protein
MFTGEKSHADGTTFWGKALADKLDLNATGFVAKHRDWFCSPEMWKAAAQVSEQLRNVTDVVAYGSSMGGYAALRWGKRCGAASVIACAPQYSIDPSVVSSFDRRYEIWFRPDIHRGMEVVRSDLVLPSYVFFDPYATQDNDHVRLLGELSTDLCLVPLINCGHECVRVFANSGRAHELLNASLSSNRTKVLELASAARHKAPIRCVEIAMRVAGRKPQLARNIYDRHSGSFEAAQRDTLFARTASVLTGPGSSVLSATGGRSLANLARLPPQNQFKTSLVGRVQRVSDSVEKIIKRLFDLLSRSSFRASFASSRIGTKPNFQLLTLTILISLVAILASIPLNVWMAIS